MIPDQWAAESPSASEAPITAKTRFIAPVALLRTALTGSLVSNISLFVEQYWAQGAIATQGMQ